MGNSHKKFMDMVVLDYEIVLPPASQDSIFMAKVAYQIKGYTLRILSAQDEYADVSRCAKSEPDNFEMLAIWHSRMAVLVQEILFCKEQVRAYRENDNKAKIIPDRCL